MIFERNLQKTTKRNNSYDAKAFARLQPKRAFIERGIILQEVFE